MCAHSQSKPSLKVIAPTEMNWVLVSERESIYRLSGAPQLHCCWGERLLLGVDLLLLLPWLG